MSKKGSVFFCSALFLRAYCVYTNFLVSSRDICASRVARSCFGKGYGDGLVVAFFLFRLGLDKLPPLVVFFSELRNYGCARAFLSFYYRGFSKKGINVSKKFEAFFLRLFSCAFPKG